MLVPPVSAAYYKVGFSCLVGVYLGGSVYGKDRYLFCNASQPTMKVIGCEILLYVVLYSGLGVLAKINRLVLN